MATETKTDFSAVVFWGSLWGAFEATVGYFLHAIDFKIGWLIWYPVAFYFTTKVFRVTGKKSAVFFTSLIAASIKLVNLFLPTRLDKVINPAVSIVLEGIVIVALLVVLEKRQTKLSYQSIFLANLSWKGLYLTYLLFMPRFFIELSAWRGVVPFLKFLVWESILSSLVIFIGVKLLSLRKQSRLNKTPFGLFRKHKSLRLIVSLAVFIMALFLQWFL